MAHVEYLNGNKRSVSRGAGLNLWKALRNPERLDEQQLEKIQNIKALYLAWREAPDDYVQENLKWIVPLAVNEWTCDFKGRPGRPQTDSAWTFAKKWNLWHMGQPTYRVTSLR